MQKIRPCVIVSPKELNDHLDTVIIIPVTSAIHGYPYRVRCHIMKRADELHRREPQAPIGDIIPRSGFDSPSNYYKAKRKYGEE